MKPYTLFYAGRFHSDSDAFPPAWSVPDGTFLLCMDGIGRTWYYKPVAGWMPINLCDVPAELKTYVMLMT